eukprot:TRINITY_DN3237_c0_g1_i5.p1 TRINITY_DN3237_c0_g1~~TRINITY_DN3237_c0_g1_i5.p1  ORF type:complete len:1193 (+),score=204.69 TRINITY_DN3237_c0_g1_i5:671-4249(+)
MLVTNLDLVFIDSSTKKPTKLTSTQERIDWFLLANRELDRFWKGQHNEVIIKGRKQTAIHQRWTNQKRIEKLVLSDNEITVIPHHIQNLTNLIHLDLSDNKINFVAPVIESLKSLKTLILSNNGIEFLPEGLGSLSDLTSLDISGNELRELPESISRMKSLVELNISNNKLEVLPTWLGMLRHLKDFKFEKNRLRSKLIPKEIIARGSQAVLSFLRAKAQDCIKCCRMKLMLVGQGNVGKTSLLTALQSKSGKRKKGTDNMATDGIDISTWQVKTKKDTAETKMIHFSAWDFAGQEVYYSTHGFFLSTRAVYLLVYDLTKTLDACRVPYWLQSIHAHTGGCVPVVLVGTHVDDKICTNEYVETVSERVAKLIDSLTFPIDIKYHIVVSTAKGTGIKDLKKKLVEVALELPYMPEEIPKSYLIMEEKIQNKISGAVAVPTVNWKEFEAIARESSIPEEDALTAAEFLSDLGVVQYFKSINEDVVILDPQWITKMFATLVTARANLAKEGIVCRSFLSQLWTEPSYPKSLHPFLLKLLETFEIVYSIDEEQILVPCLLGEERMKNRAIESTFSADFTYQDNIFSRYYLLTFIPIGFFSRLLVKSMSCLKWKVTDYWKNGVALNEDTNNLILELDEARKEMTLRVRGRNPLPAFLAIVEAIDTLLSESLQVKSKTFAACPHCLRREKTHASDSVNKISLELLENAVNDKKTTIPCKMELGMEYTKTMADAPPPLIVDDTISIPQNGFLKQSSSSTKKLSLVRMLTSSKDRKTHHTWQSSSTLSKRLAPQTVDVQFVIQMQDIVPDLCMSHNTAEKIKREDIEFEASLGSGSFAKVWKGQYRGRDVAVKELFLLDENSPLIKRAVLAEMRREVYIMSCLDHPNIIRLQGIVLEPPSMVMELMSEGTLYRFLHDEEKKIDWKLKLSLIRDMASALEYLFDKHRIIHRDLKSPNVLLNYEINDEGEPTYVAKIADFGFSRSVALVSELTRSVVENPVWLAPEVIENRPYSEKADVYSLGVIMWEIVTRQNYFDDVQFQSMLEKMVIRGDRPSIPAYCHTSLAQLIEKCWANDPNGRPSFRDILDALASMSAEDFERYGESVKEKERLAQNACRGLCPFVSFGCPIVVEDEKSLAVHMAEGNTLHMGFLVQKIGTMELEMKQMRETISKLEEQNKEHPKRTDKLFGQHRGFTVEKEGVE